MGSWYLVKIITRLLLHDLSVHNILKYLVFGTITPTEKLEVNGNIKANNLWKCLCNGQKAYMFGLDANIDALYGSMIYYEDISGNDCWVAADRPSPGHYTLVCTKL